MGMNGTQAVRFGQAVSFGRGFFIAPALQLGEPCSRVHKGGRREHGGRCPLPRS